MSSNQRFPEDLLVRARRGELLAEEEKPLKMLLGSSEVARVWYEAGIGFDAASPVLPGDEELLARLTDRVSKASARRSTRAWWRVGLPAAAASLIATTAAAGGWIVLQRNLRPEPSAEAGVRPAAAHSVASARRHEPARVIARPAVPPPEIEPPRDGSPSVTRKMPPIPSRTPRATAGGGELFERANRARREGRSGEAMALYQQVTELSPGSAAAEQAELALGELNLQRGVSLEALRHFRRYRGQAMSAEALWGEARALRQLGRVAEERNTLSTLCQRFPSFPYAAPACKRLGSLQE